MYIFIKLKKLFSVKLELQGLHKEKLLQEVSNRVALIMISQLRKNSQAIRRLAHFPWKRNITVKVAVTHKLLDHSIKNTGCEL